MQILHRLYYGVVLLLVRFLRVPGREENTVLPSAVPVKRHWSDI